MTHKANIMCADQVELVTNPVKVHLLIGPTYINLFLRPITFFEHLPLIY